MKQLLHTLFFFLLLKQICFGQWIQNNGPYGGNVRFLAATDTNLFAWIWDGGFFSSTNSGNSWTAANAGLPEGQVSSFAKLGQNIFVGFLYSGLFLSTNNGTTWVQVNNGLPIEFLWALMVSGEDLFAATDDGVFVSTDNGASWKAMNNGLTNRYVRALAVSGKDLFAGTYHGGVFRSTNRGVTWTVTNDGLMHTDVRDIAVLGTDIFAGTDGGVFRSTDNGIRWAAVNNGLTITWVNRLAVLGTNLFVATDFGAFRSTNGGTDWTDLNIRLMNTSINTFATSGTNLFVGTGCGVFLSTDSGSIFSHVSNGLIRRTVLVLSSQRDNLFAGTEDGIFYSTNSGTSWDPVEMWAPVMCFAAAGEKFLAGTNGGGVLLSTNFGGSWKTVNTGLTENGIWNISALAISGERIFAACGGSGGKGDNYWYVGRGVFLCTDTGSIWTEVNEGLPLSPTPGDSTSVIPISCLLAVGQNVFAGTNGAGVFLTTNNGTSWTAVNSGLPPTVLSLAVSETNLFAGTSGNGVYLSTNNGTSWAPINSGLPVNKSAYALSVGGENLFISLVDDSSFTGVGIYLSTDNGTNWTPVSTGLPTNTIVNAFTFSSTNLFAGTDGSGVWKRPLTEMIVPVELNSFTALANGKVVTLSWSTTTELNNQGFEVQRKFGSNNFVTIGSVKGHGTATSPNNYTYIDKLTDAGKYFYRLKQMDYGGQYSYSQVVEVDVRMLNNYTLEQNYPNPFNPTTTIGYVLQEKSNAKLTLLNAIGEEIAALVNEEQDKGYHKVEFDASKLTSGVYFYQLRAGSFVETKKMILLR